VRVGLIAPATITDFDHASVKQRSVRALAEHVPVGVLTLVSILRARGVDVRFVDTNRLYLEFLREGGRGDLAAWLAGRIAELGLDVAGLSTISSSYPLTLRLASALRRAGAGAIVLGGPQASAVDRETLAAFPDVDFVVRGEADDVIGPLVDALAAGDVGGVPSVTLRAGGGVVRTPAAPAPPDMDAIPLPAYDLFATGDEATIPIEVGRGCPYGCTFCSTNDFFRRRFRLKTPAVLVRQLAELAARYGARAFDFVHDMLTVVREDVIALCDALLAEGAPYEWTCSARTDRVDDELLDRMVAAGCRGIFFGVETGSPGLQRLIRKRLHVDVAERRIEAAARRGLTTVVSLITGFPDETAADLGDTVALFVRSLRHRTTAPQLHILAPLAGTPIHEQYRDRLRFDDVLSDLSHAGFAIEGEDRALILAHPQIFSSFYAVPTALDREHLKQLRTFLLECASSRRWLLLALHLEAGALEAFGAFRRWQAAHGAGALVDDLDRFVLDELAPSSPAGAALEALVAVHRAVRAGEGAGAATPHPRRAPGVAVVRVGVDLAALLRALAALGDLRGVPRGSFDVIVRATPDGVLEALSIHPAAAAVLRLCDGHHSLDQIARDLAALEHDLDAPPELLCTLALEALRDDGLVLGA
jgi:radical SAM superfamily enzyme YgiQ (UPF0313 family)